jgi:hypothetical protein
VTLALAVGLSGVARAELQQSTSYSMNESEVGAMGDFTAGSAHYSFAPGDGDAGSTLGENAVGNSASTNYQSNGGFNPTAQPGTLAFVVDTPSIDFGNVSVGTKTTALATFHVRNYTSYGYAVTIIGTPPTYAGHQLSALTTDTAYNATAEQFGVNLVNNTVTGVGADPVQNPTGFGFGVAGDGTTNHYTQSDKWRFNAGETVASAPKSSGNTDYTATFMMNAIQTTPGGKYTGNIGFVVTGTY